MVPLLLGALALIGLVYASVLVRTARAKGAFGFGADSARKLGDDHTSTSTRRSSTS